MSELSFTVFCVVSFALGAVAGGFFYSFIDRKKSSTRADDIDMVLKLTTEKLSSERELTIKELENKQQLINSEFSSLSKQIELMMKNAAQNMSSERQTTSSEFENKKELIDSKLGLLDIEVKKVREVISSLEEKRASQIAELKTMIDNSSKETKNLADVTSSLQNTLSSKQARGSWAERMANDILSLSGMVEGVNYIRQEQTASATKPDFTFFLPNKMKLNMDVKFPLENYQRYNESTDSDRSVTKDKFIKSIKSHIDALDKREYINAEDNTLNSVLMFIPNEKIFATIIESDSSMIDYAVSKRVLICSPVTIISILAIIRQAADNFMLEQKAKDLLIAMARFAEEWKKYIESFDKLGEQINKVSDKYNELRTTRSNKLDSSIRKLDELKSNTIIESD